MQTPYTPSDRALAALQLTRDAYNALPQAVRDGLASTLAKHEPKTAVKPAQPFTPEPKPGEAPVTRAMVQFAPASKRAVKLGVGAARTVGEALLGDGLITPEAFSRFVGILGACESLAAQVAGAAGTVDASQAPAQAEGDEQAA